MLTADGTGCVPLVCVPPLAALFNTSALRIFNASGSPVDALAAANKPALSRCAGCPAGTAGVYPTCTACAADELCLGPTSVPLIDFAAASSLAAVCPPLTGPAALAALSASSASTVRSGFSWLTNVLTVDGALLAGIVCVALLLSALAAAMLLRTCCGSGTGCCARMGAALNGALKSADLFNMAPAEVDGESPRRASTAVGGFFTLLGVTTLATVASALVLQRAASNIATARSIDVLSADARAELAALPFAAAPPWGVGLQVRITASGEPGKCTAPIDWDAKFLDAGEWVLDAPRGACGAEAATSAQLVFRCAACALSPASTLDIELHYSCQALLIEAGALDANATVSALALPPSETRGAPGALLSSVTWTLLTLASTLTVLPPVPRTSARGYAFAGSSHVTTMAPLATAPAALGGATLVAPLKAAIRVRVQLELQPFFLNVVLSERIPITALLSTLVGLSGIFGFFGTLRGLAFKLAPTRPTKGEHPLSAGEIRALRALAGGGGGSGESATKCVAARAGQEPAARGSAFSVENPLRQRRGGERPAAAAAIRVRDVADCEDVAVGEGAHALADAETPRLEAAAQRAPRLWRRFVESPADGSATFFIAVDSGETAWVIPAGGEEVADEEARSAAEDAPDGPVKELSEAPPVEPAEAPHVESSDEAPPVEPSDEASSVKPAEASSVESSNEAPSIEPADEAPSVEPAESEAPTTSTTAEETRGGGSGSAAAPAESATPPLAVPAGDRTVPAHATDPRRVTVAAARKAVVEAAIISQKARNAWRLAGLYRY